MTTKTLSRRVRAPEDIQIGDFIVVLTTRYQVLPDNIEASAIGSEFDPLQVTMIPSEAGQPMKVVSLCLPFIMTEAPGGSRSVVDTRRHALAYVDKHYAMAAKSPNDKKKDARKKRKGKDRKKS